MNDDQKERADRLLAQIRLTEGLIDASRQNGRVTMTVGVEMVDALIGVVNEVATLARDGVGHVTSAAKHGRLVEIKQACARVGIELPLFPEEDA